MDKFKQMATQLGHLFMQFVDFMGRPIGEPRDEADDGEDSFFSEPQHNVDGTPMCGSVDAHGRPYGVTD